MCISDAELKKLGYFEWLSKVSGRLANKNKISQEAARWLIENSNCKSEGEFLEFINKDLKSYSDFKELIKNATTTSVIYSLSGVTSARTWERTK